MRCRRGPGPGGCRPGRVSSRLRSGRRGARRAAGTGRGGRGRTGATRFPCAGRSPSRLRQGPRARDTAHAGGAGMRGAVGVARDTDRVGERLPGGRGPPGFGRGAVRGRGEPGRHGRRASGSGREIGRLPAGSRRRRRAGGQGRAGAHGHHSTGARHDDVSHRVTPCGPGRFGVRSAATRSGYPRRRSLTRTGHGRHIGRKGHRPQRHGPDSDRGQLGANRRDAARRRRCAGRHIRLRSHPRRGRALDDRQRRHRPMLTRRCAGFICILGPGRWWRWSRGHASFLVGWPNSSGYAISVAALRIATRRSGTATTHSRGPTAVRPPRTTVWDCARAATTPRKSLAGGSARQSTKITPTARYSRRRPTRATDRWPRRAPPRSRSARWKSASGCHSRDTRPRSLRR